MGYIMQFVPPQQEQVLVPPPQQEQVLVPHGQAGLDQGQVVHDTLRVVAMSIEDNDIQRRVADFAASFARQEAKAARDDRHDLTCVRDHLAKKSDEVNKAWASGPLKILEDSARLGVPLTQAQLWFLKTETEKMVNHQEQLKSAEDAVHSKIEHAIKASAKALQCQETVVESHKQEERQMKRDHAELLSLADEADRAKKAKKSPEKSAEKSPEKSAEKSTELSAKLIGVVAAGFSVGTAIISKFW